MVHKWLKYLGYGVCWGCTFFVLISVVGFLTAGEAFFAPIVPHYARHALGAVLVGVCCGSSSIVYTFEKLALWQQICVHAATGLTGYFLTAYFLGWMPLQSAGHVVFFVVLGVLTFAAIWACFYLYNRHEAKKVNARLKQLDNADGPEN